MLTSAGPLASYRNARDEAVFGSHSLCHADACEAWTPSSEPFGIWMRYLVGSWPAPDNNRGKERARARNRHSDKEQFRRDPNRLKSCDMSERLLKRLRRSWFSRFCRAKQLAFTKFIYYLIHII